ncbi:beta-lactamase family protein [Christensenellaceae bacterium NSJ-44]|uniref:Beta-lactamase family protein n=1 Tax=Luoshenia tenuis TaxID=2763654 RepID=A0A926CYA4_9FIRM|nr:serine hydrolase domain-containing protein [Luoshenia tenuis]MBC8528368.1 beta-lactamase family protein [Luoshenia tenuis]
MNTKPIDALLKQFTTMERGPVGCALSVTKAGKTIYTGYSGYADAQAQRPIGEETLYRMYSCSKVVTAVAMMILLERGLYQLDDPIAQYLPEFADARYAICTGNNMETLLPVRALTIKHFLTMTSGLTYGGELSATHARIGRALSGIDEKGGCTTREFSRIVAKLPLKFEPGTSWNYGINLDVLGAFIEEVSGSSFYQFLREEIFSPLGMEDTGFFLDGQGQKRLATMYYYDEDGCLKINDSEDFKYEAAYRFECGGGGLVSSLHDMTRFTKMLALGGRLDGQRILGRKTIELMRQNHLEPQALEAFRQTHQYGWPFMAGYGYGLGVKTLMDLAGSNCAGSLGEFSWAGAAGTLLLVDPSEQLSIVYMHQLMPNNREGYCHPRLRNVIYGALD